MRDIWEHTSGIGSHQVWIHAITSRRPSGRVQRRRVRGDTHGDKHDQEIDPDGEIGEPSEFLQRSDLAQKEAGEGPDETADRVAQLEF